MPPSPSSTPPPKFQSDIDISSVSLRQLEELTRKGFRTVKAAIIASGIAPVSQNKNAKFYDTAEALEALYRHVLLADLSPDEVSSEVEFDEEGNPLPARQRLDPQFEAAMLNKRRREKVEIETKILKRGLMKTDDVQKTLEDFAMAARGRVMQVPRQAAVVLIGVTDPKQIESVVEGLIHEALSDLSRLSPSDVTPLAESVDEDSVDE